MGAFKRVTEGRLTAFIPCKGEVDAGGAQGRVDGRINDLVEGFLERGIKLQSNAVPQRVECTPLRVIRGGILGAEFVFDALQSTRLPR